MHLCITKKFHKMVAKKQLLIILLFLSCLSFQTRNRLNSCIRNQLPFCLLRIAFWLLTHQSGLFKFKDSIHKHLHSHLPIIHFYVVAAMQHMMVKLRDLFVQVLEHLEITPLTQILPYGPYFLRRS